MTPRNGVTDDQLGQYYRRVGAIAERLNKSLPFETVMRELQKIHDGEFIKSHLSATSFLECDTGGQLGLDILSELAAAGISVSEKARTMISYSNWKIGWREKVRFAQANVKSLGFLHSPTWQEMLDRIEEMGYFICKNHDGPSIRLAFDNQLRSSSLWCAMEPIDDFDGEPSVFGISCLADGKLGLTGSTFRLEDRMGLSNAIVFRLSE